MSTFVLFPPSLRLIQGDIYIPICAVILSEQLICFRLRLIVSPGIYLYTKETPVCVKKHPSQSENPTHTLFRHNVIIPRALTMTLLLFNPGVFIT